MAIVQNLVIGRATQNAGNMIFYTVLGKNVMRAMPFQYRDAKTPAQLIRRNKLKYSTKIGVSFKPLYLDYGIKKSATLFQMYPHNLIVQACINNITVDEFGITDLTTGTHFGVDEIPPLYNVSIIAQANKEILYHFDDDSPLSGDKKDDLVSFVFINITNYDTSIQETSSTRASIDELVPTPNYWNAGDRVICFSQCINIDKVLNSSWVNNGIVELI